MVTKRPVRIAIAGFSGRIGVRHTQYVLDHQEAELAALIDPGPGAWEVAAQLSPQTPFFKTVAEMLSALNGSDSKPEAAIICVPNNLHVQVAKGRSKLHSIQIPNKN